MLGRLFGVIARNAQPESPSELLEFSFENGQTLEVPGDWNTQDERLFFYRGTVWYKRTFEYRFEVDERTFLYFGAANYDTSMYLNGERIGRHVGGTRPSTSKSRVCCVRAKTCWSCRSTTSTQPTTSPRRRPIG